MSTANNNFLVMTFYVIGLAYTFNRMIDSIDDKIKFVMDKKAIEEKLKEYGIDDIVGITLKFNPSYELDELKELILILENKSENRGIYIDWDNCSIVVEHDKSSRRVIRKSPDVTRDLGITQIPSLVAPKKTLSQALTAEDVFTFDAEKQIYSNTKALIDIIGKGLKESPVKAKKILYKDFMSRKKTLEFSLQLVLRISELRVGLVPGEDRPPMYLINCPVTISKLPWSYAMPWNKKR